MTPMTTSYFTNPAGSTIAIQSDAQGAIAALVQGKGKRRTFRPFSAGPSEDALVEVLQLIPAEG